MTVYSPLDGKITAEHLVGSLFVYGCVIAINEI